MSSPFGWQRKALVVEDENETARLRWDRRSGVTLIEILLAVSLIIVIMVGVSSGALALQKGVNHEVSVNTLYMTAQRALDRIVSTAGQAITTDWGFGFSQEISPGFYSLMQFRLIDSFNGATPVYDDQLKVFIFGDTDKQPRCAGVVIGRGPLPATIANCAAGTDATLGTVDDNDGASLGSGVPAVTMLVPSHYAPMTGKMLTIEPKLDEGLAVVFTLRINAIGQDGAFIYPNDLVFSQRVALRQ